MLCCCYCFGCGCDCCCCQPLVSDLIHLVQCIMQHYFACCWCCCNCCYSCCCRMTWRYPNAATTETMTKRARNIPCVDDVVSPSRLVDKMCKLFTTASPACLPFYSPIRSPDHSFTSLPCRERRYLRTANVRSDWAKPIQIGWLRSTWGCCGDNDNDDNGLRWMKYSYHVVSWCFKAYLLSDMHANWRIDKSISIGWGGSMDLSVVGLLK